MPGLLLSPQSHRQCLSNVRRRECAAFHQTIVRHLIFHANCVLSVKCDLSSKEYQGLRPGQGNTDHVCSALTQTRLWMNIL